MSRRAGGCHARAGDGGQRIGTGRVAAPHDLRTADPRVDHPVGRRDTAAHSRERSRRLHDDTRLSACARPSPKLVACRLTAAGTVGSHRDAAAAVVPAHRPVYAQGGVRCRSLRRAKSGQRGPTWPQPAQPEPRPRSMDALHGPALVPRSPRRWPRRHLAASAGRTKHRLTIISNSSQPYTRWSNAHRQLVVVQVRQRAR